MRVYHPTPHANHTLFIAPAADPRSVNGSIDADWFTELGEPRSFEVCFVDGKATVPDSVGRYLLATKQAKRTSLILPSLIAA